MAISTSTATANLNKITPRFDGIVVIVGAFGSGKTEVAVNLAALSREAGSEVWIADLDLVNPYFRTREARVPLTRMGIGVVLPPEIYLHADLPILTPLVAGAIRRTEGLVILDVGGNDVGATVLASLADAFHASSLEKRPFHVLFVMNPFRPFTGTLSGCMKMRKSIERASKLAITGIIGNANLMEETRAEDIEEGYRFVRAFSEKSRLPLEMITIPYPLLKQTDITHFSCPVLSIQRQLVPPWKKPAGFHFDRKSDS
ncbi:MAG: cobalamin biosynthesis protein CbiA [Desulfobacterales bacterium CG07_land_8_20_14_0_80_52_14]|nr:MAG: cobalamin biosynthesis protein CbiA [Desulfobacterales bacterium CG23_combo_of_CG06-09_8_20_14_all_52_9]PIU49428.1 MAG: cobalamin biosynthesis protein CbiA [Desulfobacterales bacterium CG07_land_8_20_14_0_80_52_14]